jgi:uncharacterized protein YbjT (DUF2867 family)
MILVTGATGSIGTHLVRRLGALGQQVRAFVRDEAKGRTLGCELVVGDLDDPASVASAMVGVDRVFLNAGGAVPVTGEQPMIRQQQAVIDAARAARVRHVVKISVWGAREQGKLAEGAHWRIEEYLKRSGIAWSILRPSGFMQNFLTGAGSFTDGGDLIGAYGEGRVSYIDCADLAASAATLLAGDTGTDRTYLLSGPEALSHTGIAAALTRALGTTVRYIDLPPAAFAERLTTQGLPPDFAADVAALFAEVAAGTLAGTTDSVLRLTGRAPRTFDAFLAEHREQLRNRHFEAHGAK